jgi:hypothetical protein
MFTEEKDRNVKGSDTRMPDSLGMEFKHHKRTGLSA